MQNLQVKSCPHRLFWGDFDLISCSAGRTDSDSCYTHSIAKILETTPPKRQTKCGNEIGLEVSEQTKYCWDRMYKGWTTVQRLADRNS